MTLRLAFLDLQNLPEGKRNIRAEVVRIGAPGPDHKKAVAVRFRDLDLANRIFGELLRGRIRTSSALLGIIQALSPDADIGTVMETICRTTQRALEAESVLIFRRDPQKSVLRALAPVGQPLDAALLIAGEGFVAGLAEDPELPAQFRHWLAGAPQTADFHPSPNTPSKASLPPPKGQEV